MGSVGPTGDGGTKGWMVGVVRLLVHGVAVDVEVEVDCPAGREGKGGVAKGAVEEGVADEMGGGVAKEVGGGVVGAVLLLEIGAT